MTHPADALRLVRFLAAKGAERAGCNGWRAEALCRQIVEIIDGAAPESPLPEGGGHCSGISGELSGWQDLSGAPRDGSEFQAWWKGTWQPRARFDPEYGSFQLWGRTDFDTEGWEVFEIDGFWQPQPAAPTGDRP